MAEFFGPGDQRAVSRDLVMFDRLRTRHDGGVEHGLVVDLARDRVGFLDQAVDRRAVRRLGFLAEFLEDLLQAIDLGIGFFEMRFEAGGEITVGGLLDHLRQRPGDLLLGIIDVLQAVHEHVFHGCDVFGEKSHLNLLWVDGISDAEQPDLFLMRAAGSARHDSRRSLRA